MPYYYWRGVTLDAVVCKGTLFAHTAEALDAILFKQDIALIGFKRVRQVNLMPISRMSKLAFFEHLQALLDAGVHLFQALVIISQQTSDARFADSIYHMSRLIQEGKSLHDALAQYPWIFDQEMIHITHIGMQAGNISIALQALCYYLHQADQFNKRVRNALLLPLCTLGIFVSILLIMLLVIVPRYVDLFVSMGKELPAATHMLLVLHTFVKSYYMIGSCFILIVFIFVIFKYRKSVSAKMRFDSFILKMPFVGPLLQRVYLAQLLQSLAMLLQGGMSLVPAIGIVSRSVNNGYVKDQIEQLLDKVQSGQSLSEAMQSSRSGLFSQDLILLTLVGEQTACLNVMMQRAAKMYQKDVEQKISRYTTVLQPALMILLGLLVAGLIFALYLPLFNLADTL